MRPDIDLRGYLDTRGATIVLTLSVLAIAAFAALGGLIQPAVMPQGTSDVEFTFIVLTLPLSLILPVIAVLMTAGEWSDSSIQNTFLQRPGRLGVLGSKVLAALAVTVVLVALAIGLAAAATWIGGELVGDGAVFSSFDSLLTTQLAVVGSAVLFGLAMGILLQSTVLGLIAAIGLPFVISTASGLAMVFGSETVSDVIRAVDLTAAATALGSGQATAFELLPLLLMVLLPAALGVRRWNRREVG
ncbi:ABC transporter permease [Brachybacterium saurashtrense]|uniref:ABC transporter permease n=1 Tax=Brachybacterium saurashtrense TaxID=556288 RepID=A0A345YPR8_9MICO|nr:ABC transporter permease [Brachybacterium saurashtrense]AXK45920.1 ABC transporter permease [Brachybacterium saurashtrense]RRR23658.1 ABC transporter permease [Brachybacterium saurashtrense]